MTGIKLLGDVEVAKRWVVIESYHFFFVKCYGSGKVRSHPTYALEVAKLENFEPSSGPGPGCQISDPVGPGKDNLRKNGPGRPSMSKYNFYGIHTKKNATIEETRTLYSTTVKIIYLVSPISGRGVVFIHPSGFSCISPKRFELGSWNFLTFPKTNLGILPENVKLIAAPGAVPGHGNSGGDIRKVSVWANIVISIEHNCLHQLSKWRQQ